MTSHLLKTLREVLMDAVHVNFDFFKVLIPIRRSLPSWTGSAIWPCLSSPSCS